jgi:hypothetical protein
VTHKIAPDLTPLATPIDQLDPLPGNPRRGDVDAVARSYSTFGQRKPIVARRGDDDRGTVLAGNHQLAAAKLLGWTHIAVVWTDDDDATAKAFALADNRVGDLGDYDADALAEMIHEVMEGDAALLGSTGFDQETLNKILEEGGYIGDPSEDWSEAMDALPDGDKGDFETMTLQLHKDQAATIRAAIELVWQGSQVDTSLNTNRKGSAITAIVGLWLAQKEADK